ncbi:MAG TPA: type II toxin-antitoxin system HicB family antitoxin [Thermoanaerobaculia bacterium]|nr:type II toxin-antitoxin system HicB family antitoxin [Thermoanaerobaculia bacterium]
MSEPSMLLTRTEPRFKAVVHIEPEGGYWAEVPELPGCFTQGDTLDEIYRNLPEAIACHLDLDPSSIRIGLLEMAAES